MKPLDTILATLLSFVNSLRSKTEDVQTVPSVDLQRYMGRWYEISSYRQWFEKGLTDVSALYTSKDGYVEVINSGYKNGKLQEAHGRALVVRNSNNSKLRVSFFRPFYGQYWIIDLAEDYSWVVVSNAHRSTLWILSRETEMDQMLYESILNRLNKQGFDTSKLEKMELTH